MSVVATHSYDNLWIAPYRTFGVSSQRDLGSIHPSSNDLPMSNDPPQAGERLFGGLGRFFGAAKKQGGTLPPKSAKMPFSGIYGVKKKLAIMPENAWQKGQEE